ncbi:MULTISPECIES: ComF family protein [Caproicibacterium]|uniref:ComF family protein n=1 Tax=Caproicibacterium argilliputei TaxID=3030016 RepID=A0AA97D6I6_9FIRM|nr:ComF family protein [Caproicibacterium argilliputei]WOC31181.1 ComF family protein [Caproicibacterium argilliputei]
MRKPDGSFWMDLVFPPRCPFCGELMKHGEQTCKNCRTVLPSVFQKELFCVPETVVPCYAPYAYAGKVRDAILRFKFEQEPSVGVFFGRQMAILLKSLSNLPPLDAVAAVPMTRWHRMRRGYNQSELLAKTAAAQLKLPYLRLLRKVKHSRVQHSLPAQARFGNVQGVYAARPAAVGRKILLIDDIVTTGATLTACAEELLHAGASEVVCAAAAQAQSVTDKD